MALLIETSFGSTHGKLVPEWSKPISVPYRICPTSKSPDHGTVNYGQLPEWSNSKIAGVEFTILGNLCIL